MPRRVLYRIEVGGTDDASVAAVLKGTHCPADAVVKVDPATGIVAITTPGAWLPVERMRPDRASRAATMAPFDAAIVDAERDAAIVRDATVNAAVAKHADLAALADETDDLEFAAVLFDSLAERDATVAAARSEYGAATASHIEARDDAGRAWDADPVMEHAGWGEGGLGVPGWALCGYEPVDEGKEDDPPEVDELTKAKLAHVDATPVDISKP